MPQGMCGPKQKTQSSGPVPPEVRLPQRVGRVWKTLSPGTAEHLTCDSGTPPCCAFLCHQAQGGARVPIPGPASLGSTTLASPAQVVH